MRNRIDHFRGVQSRTLCKVQAFRKPLHDAGNADLVHGFRKLAGTDRPYQSNGFGVGVHDRTGAVEQFGIATDHDRELTALGARLAARKRRVEETDGPLGRNAVDLAGQVGRCGRVIDDDRTGCRAGQNTISTQNDLAHVVIIADTGEDDIAAVGCFGRGRRRRALELLAPLRRFGRRAVIHDHILTGLRQVAGHRVSHHAEPDECGAHRQAASFCVLPCFCRGSRPIERAIISRMISELPA